MASIDYRHTPLVIFLLIAGPLMAHHSAAIFDLSHDIRIEGEVVQLRWANPHVYIQVRQEGTSNNTIIWNIEGQTPSGMSREGWTSSSLLPGEDVIIAANPARDSNRRIALGHTVLKEDGSTLFIPQANSRRDSSPSDAETSHVADSLSGHWVTKWNRDVAMGFLRARSSWQLTERGINAMESYENSLNPGNDCVPEPVPYVMIWPNGKSIKIGDDEVVIRDELGPERRIDLKSKDHSGAESSASGHSTGRWENGALVVDTVNFAPHRRGLAVGGLASGPQKHLIERFELSADKSKLHYRFQLEDPEYLAEPVSGELELIYRPDLPFINEPCDLESARIYLEDQSSN